MTWPAALILAYGFTLSGYWSLGKLVAVAGAGVWLSLGGVRRLGWAPLAYLAAVTITTLTSADTWTSTIGLHGTYNTGLLCALVLVPFWACVSREDRAGMERGLLLGVATFCVLGLIQKLVWNPTPDFAEGRASSTLGSPIYAGALCAFALPYFTRNKIISALIVGMLWATGSRGAWLAAAVGTLYAHWPWLSERKRTFVLLAVGAGLCAAFYIRPLSDLGRAATWSAALDAFKARPWLGWGTGNFYQVAEIWRNPLWDEAYGSSTQDHAHNLFFEALSTSGLIGFAALCAMMRTLWRTADRTTRAALIGVFFVGMLNPLPMAVKALCLAFCASSPTEEKKK